MANYQKLLAWQKAKDLAVALYGAVGRSSVSRDFGLRDQLLRAGVSIASNIAEGYVRESTADRTHFINIARGSCAELETQLLIAAEVGLLPSKEAKPLLVAVDEISRMLHALRRALRNEE